MPQLLPRRTLTIVAAPTRAVRRVLVVQHGCPSCGVRSTPHEPPLPEGAPTRECIPKPRNEVPATRQRYAMRRSIAHSVHSGARAPTLNCPFK